MKCNSVLIIDAGDVGNVAGRRRGRQREGEEGGGGGGGEGMLLVSGTKRRGPDVGSIKPNHRTHSSISAPIFHSVSFSFIESFIKFSSAFFLIIRFLFRVPFDWRPLIALRRLRCLRRLRRLRRLRWVRWVRWVR